MRNYYLSIGLLCLFCVGLVIGVFALTGTPAHQKGLQLDETRMSDFSSIRMSIDSYVIKNDTLPDSLSDVKEDSSYIQITDPETHDEYTYNKTSADSYELCTVFSTDGTDTDDRPYSSSYRLNNQSHKKGYDCIEVDISDRYFAPSKQRSETTPEIDGALQS